MTVEMLNNLSSAIIRAAVRLRSRETEHNDKGTRMELTRSTCAPFSRRKDKAERMIKLRGSMDLSSYSG